MNALIIAAPLLALLLPLLSVQAAGAAPPWTDRFPYAAFLVEKPTALYATPGAKPLQTLRRGGAPLPLQQASATTDADGGRYYPLQTGEFVLARPPAAGGLVEDKGRLVYLPAAEDQAQISAAAGQAWDSPQAAGSSVFLEAGTPVRPLYATVGRNRAVYVLVEHGYGSGWTPYAALVWNPSPTAQPLPPPPTPRLQAILRLLEDYNGGVERSRAYYHQTTGQWVEARTLSLVDLDESANPVRLRLGVADGDLPLEAEALLVELLRQELGDGLEIEWP